MARAGVGGLAKDLTDDEAQAAEYRFRVAQRAMAAYVGAQGQARSDALDRRNPPQRRQATMAAAQDPLKKQQILWELGTALYDAVQVYQMRGDTTRP